jgi:dipeptidyl aminopeptidase/acylaminoacyl peptidase
MRTLAVVFALLALACAAGPSERDAVPHATLAEARKGLRTSVHLKADTTPPAPPPEGVLELVSYPAPLGDNAAYVTPFREGAKRPAIVWIVGGFDWGISSGAWEAQDRSNDQSARAFREAGMVLLLPALRGSNGNAGTNECMLGEVDDVVAAARWLATRADVDPDRIYLGGHSTGGTMALLVAESTTIFRGVFAFGPVADVRHYGPDACFGPDAPDPEWQARAVWPYLATITTPTWVVEGERSGNVHSIAFMMPFRGDAPVRYVTVPGKDHFSVLAPGTEAVASEILAGGEGITAEAIVARD